MSHSDRPTIDDLAAFLSSDSDYDGEDNSIVEPKQQVGFRTSWASDQQRNHIPPQDFRSISSPPVPLDSDRAPSQTAPAIGPPKGVLRSTKRPQTLSSVDRAKGTSEEAEHVFGLSQEHHPSGTEHFSLGNSSDASSFHDGLLTKGGETSLTNAPTEPSPIILSTGKPLKSILKTASTFITNPTPAPLSSSATTALNIIDQPFSNAEELTIRIRDCLRYARSCFNAGNQPRSYSSFDIPVSECGPLITHLKHESNEAFATFICKFQAPTATSSTRGSPPIFERWALPCGPTESSVQTEASNAQWWVGRTRAATKAGPYASAAEIAFVDKNLRGAETQRRNGKGENARKKAREKMEECLRRQETSSRMYGSDDGSVEGDLEGGGGWDGHRDCREKRRHSWRS